MSPSALYRLYSLLSLGLDRELGLGISSESRERAYINIFVSVDGVIL